MWYYYYHRQHCLSGSEEFSSTLKTQNIENHDIKSLVDYFVSSDDDAQWCLGMLFYIQESCVGLICQILYSKKYYIFFFPCRYVFPGLVPITLHLCWTQRNGLGEQSLAVPAVIVLLRTVVVLLARFRSCGLSRCILSGDAPSTHASSLRPPGPVCACECKRIPAAACWDGAETPPRCWCCLFVCREIPAADDRLFSKMIHCWSFTTRTPGRTTTCFSEDWASQVE